MKAKVVCHASIGLRARQSSFRFPRGGARSVLPALNAGEDET
jgi:hypothetical protein